ncbi:MAG: hypothetical protein A3B16_01275 [Candidatus Zambryskibacteria bacterium RIFCSPLOWO2_01_FULL_45_43]|uniref:indole-3-glycerol-phosphate synthase n=2 Tax=Parcubacteria group TaxID=1794811 RepID=A0A1G1ZSU7_9BACT|nr:MAG: hypothetical protein A3H63_02115 [Candidatus Harrisonbacteria bacterium RIFCSPLOWO2_02_FULL_45_10c]OHB04818.1 MAG: hypothetical protein A3B16_01275 [Candidatus Zambryskibacteria bacterium RIFCSPLOWO2_01_FULL_45_43]
MYNGVEIIAEVKDRSPFRGRCTDKSLEELLEIAVQVGDMISIHTHEDFGGSFEWLKKARKKTNKPIVAKGFHPNDDQIVRAIEERGADWVLVVVGQAPYGYRPLPKMYLERCLIEPLTLEELKTIPNDLRAVWNSRDLYNKGNPKTETFEEARKLFNGWLCQASNLNTVQDIKPGANAVLVGTNLLQFSESLR